MKKEQRPILEELSKSEFLSFLYAEREREDQLNKTYGWTSYALLGVIIALICSLYRVIIKDIHCIDGPEVVIYLSTICAVILYIILFWNFLYKRHVYHPGKVKLLKEVFPKAEFVITFIIVVGVFVCSIHYNMVDILWTWIILLFIWLITFVFACIFKNEVVPTTFNSLYFPWPFINSLFIAIVGGLLGVTPFFSLREINIDILGVPFQIAAHISAIITILYLLFYTSMINNRLKFIDQIIDGFVYGDWTQENSCLRLSQYYLGYGVIEVCYTELDNVKKTSKYCDDKLSYLNEIKLKIENDECSILDLRMYNREVEEILSMIKVSLRKSKDITKRVNKILNMGINVDDSEIMYIFNENDSLFDKLDNLITELSAIISHIKEKINIYKVRTLK